MALPGVRDPESLAIPESASMFRNLKTSELSDSPSADPPPRTLSACAILDHFASELENRVRFRGFRRRPLVHRPSRWTPRTWLIGA